MSFMSEELKSFLHSKGIATSRTTAYSPQANGQVEKLNGTLWRAITLSLKSKGLDISQWEIALYCWMLYTLFALSYIQRLPR